MANITTAGTTYASQLALKELEWFRNGIDELSPFTQRMKATSFGVKGEDGKYYVHGGKTGRIGFPTAMISSEGSTTVPAWIDSTNVTPKWSLGEYGNQVRISTLGRSVGELIGSTSVSEQMMKDAMASIAFFKNCLFMGSPSGYLCRQTGYIDANTITVDDLSALREGLIVDGYDALSGGSKGISAKEISKIDYETGYVTITSHGGGADDTDWIFKTGQYGIMIDGLLSLLGTTATRETDNSVTVTPASATYGGLTRASTNKWQSFAMKQPFGKFDPVKWSKFLAEATIATGGGDKAGWSAIYCSLKSSMALSEALEYDKKGMGEHIVYGDNRPVQFRSTLLAKGAMDIIVFKGIGDHKLLCVDETRIGLREPAPGNWVGAESGDIWTDNARETTGKPTWTAAWLGYGGLIGDPFAQAVYYNFDVL